MTPINAQEAQAHPLKTDAQIHQRVEDLVGTALRRQTWIMYLDSTDKQLPVVMPMMEIPIEVGDDNADILAGSLSEMARDLGATQVMLVWERRGGRTLCPPERDWMRDIRRAFAETDIALRAQLLCHSGGVRWISPDDFI